MKRIPLIAFLILIASAAGAGAQTADTGGSSIPQPCFIGTSLFTLANFIDDDQPPRFYQVDVGFQVTPKDRFTVQAITWQYYHPLGIPWQDAPEAKVNEYPGHIREVGVGLEYQRMLTKRFYSSISAIPFFRQYYDTQNQKIDNGMLLYITARVGYHIPLMDRLFLEPAIGFNFWPVATNVPASFKVQDERWNSYFLFEPGLNIGFRF